MCGIFSWAGRSPKTFDKHKFDILGIFNETRGKDSCGLSIDGDIFIGVEKNKVYRDWLHNVNYTAPEKIPIVLGHTRHATAGAFNTDNAHPFGFGQVGDSYEFIGLHNGSLLNHETLAQNRNIPLEVEVQKTGYKTTRKKIDSEILLESIYTDKNFKVLSEYNGAAAVVFYNVNEPNVMYCFHGASPETEGDEKRYIERPLFYYKESKYSVYISSLEESLFAIGGKPDTVKEFTTNIVYKITNGDVERAEESRISRKGRYHKYPKSKTYNFPGPINNDHNCNFTPSKNQNRSTSSEFKKDKGNLNIYNLKVDQNSYRGRIYEHQLRYWRNGNRIMGCYTWIPEFGFYFLGKSPKDSEDRFFDLINEYFYETDFIYNEKELKKYKDKCIIPFPSLKGKEITKAPIFYFFDGIRVRTREDYRACLETIDGKIKFDYDAMSICSCHPVIDIGARKLSTNQGIIWNDRRWEGTYVPLGSENIYTVENGNLVEFKKMEDKKVIILPSTAKLDDIIETFDSDNFDTVINDREEEEVDKILMEPYRKFAVDIKRLKKHKSKKSKDALQILENFVRDATALVAIEIND